MAEKIQAFKVPKVKKMFILLSQSHFFDTAKFDGCNFRAAHWPKEELYTSKESPEMYLLKFTMKILETLVCRL